MTEEVERNGDEQVETLGGEAGFEPRSKYERIMLAAAEASRLNEEMRRKGIKLDNKVTIEAIKRVDEGKVKGVLRESVEVEEEVLTPLTPEAPAGPLFEEPPLTAPPSDGAETADEEATDDAGDGEKE